MKNDLLQDGAKKNLKIIEEAQRDAAQKIARSFQNNFPLINFSQYIANTLKPIVAFQEALAEAIKPALLFQESIKAMIPVIDFKPLIEAGKKLAEEGIKLDALLKTGWWYCPSMEFINREDIKIAAIKYKQGNRKVITQLFLTSYKKNSNKLLIETVKSWENNPLFKDRMIVIKDALKAHMNGLYTLSIPALLPIGEGIASDYCKEKGIDTSSIRSKGDRKIINAFQELERSGLYPFLFPDLFMEIIENMIYKDTNLLKDPFHKKLNRHGILHGSYIKYYDAPRSLRCFLLLDALSGLK